MLLFKWRRASENFYCYHKFSKSLRQGGMSSIFFYIKIEEKLNKNLVFLFPALKQFAILGPKNVTKCFLI